MLRFSATGADTITINYTSEVLPINGSGIYEKSVWISPLQDTTIKITAKNKYFSQSEEYTVSREITDEEIQAEKDAEAQVKEQEMAEERAKKQQLEDEKKTYASISYAKLKKSTSSYAGKRIKFHGEIFTASESNGITAFQINTDNGGYGDQVVVVADWSNDYVE